MAEGALKVLEGGIRHHRFIIYWVVESMECGAWRKNTKDSSKIEAAGHHANMMYKNSQENECSVELEERHA